MSWWKNRGVVTEKEVLMTLQSLAPDYSLHHCSHTPLSEWDPAKWQRLREKRRRRWEKGGNCIPPLPPL